LGPRIPDDLARLKSESVLVVEVTSRKDGSTTNRKKSAADRENDQKEVWKALFPRLIGGGGGVFGSVSRWGVMRAKLKGKWTSLVLTQLRGLEKIKFITDEKQARGKAFNFESHFNFCGHLPRKIRWR